MNPVLLYLTLAAAPGATWLDQQPLRFEASPGPYPYVARARGYAMALQSSRHDLLFPDRRISARLVAPLSSATLTPENPLPLQATYFHGGQRRTAHNYSRVRTRGVYPGIDLLFHGRDGQLEYDFLVAPGADPSRIAFDLEGAAPRLTPTGDLDLGHGVHWKRPEIYQLADDGARRSIPGHFRLNGHRVSFALGSYDPSRELVIDPVLAFATFAGKAAADSLRGIAVDGSGNVYVAGTTLSPDLSRSVGPNFGGAFGTSLMPVGDAFIAKFTSTGTLAYLTYLGGDWEDCAMAIAVDREGNAYLTGFTTSPNFPTTPGVRQTRNAGTAGNPIIRFGDAFVAKLNPAGDQLLYSTLLGGARDDAGTAIAIDSAGNAYIGGVTQSLNFPVSESAPQRQLAGAGGQPTFFERTTPLFQTGDGFVAKLNPTGSALVWSTYLGGAQDELVTSIAVDSATNVYVAGGTLSPSFPTTTGAYQTQYRGFDLLNDSFRFGDGFVTKYNAAGTNVLYSTFLGGTGDDVIQGLTLDSTGAAYVAGSTSTRNLPTTANVFQSSYQGPPELGTAVQIFGDAFVAKLNPAGSGLAFLTYLGGASDDAATGIALDPAGNIYVSGFTQSPNFRVTPDAAQSAAGQPYAQGGGGDAFLAVLDPTAGRVTYSTYWGGRGPDVALGIAVDPAGNAYLTGVTGSPNLRGTPRVFQMAPGGSADGFIARFSGFNTPANLPALRSVVNAASNAAGVVSPGMIFVGYGERLGPSPLVGAAVEGGRLATNRSGVTIRFDGTPSPLVYVSAGQVSGVVPYNVAGKPTVQVTVEYQGQISAPLTVRVAETAPGLFSANSSGSGAAAALNQDGTFNSAAPADPESVVVLFGTGEGRTDPTVADGSVINAAVRPVAPVTVTIGGIRADVLYAGAAPGNVAGLFQINVRLPAGVRGSAPVIVNVGGIASQTGLTLNIR